MENPSLLIHPGGRLSLEDKPIVTNLKPDEVLVEVSQCGICGSDLHLIAEQSLAHYRLERAHVLGHEAGGTVVQKGSAVNHLKIGDRVAMEPGQPCWDCEHCKSGRYHLCFNVVLHGIPHKDGFLRRRLVHSAEFCFKIPDTVSDQDSALVEPLAVGYWTCRRAQVFPGARVLVLGAGPIALCVLLNLKAAGVGYVVMTDVRENSLQRAKTMGADACVQVSPKEDPAEVAKKLLPAMGGSQADITIDCVGFEHTMRTAIFATKSAGNVTIVGLGQHEVKLPILDAVFKEVDIRGVNRYPHCFPHVIRMLENGSIKTDGLVTSTIPLKNAQEAFKLAQENKDGQECKIHIRCSDK